MTAASLVATGSHEHSLIVWDVRTGELALGPFAHDDVVLAVAFHPRDPAKLLSAGWDGTIRLWKPRTGRAYFIAGYTPGGAPYGIYLDELDDDYLTGMITPGRPGKLFDLDLSGP